MNRTDSPAKQAKPFGVNGQREPLLPTTPAGDNTASYDQGFPPVTMILKSAGGLPPKGQDMNQILFELSSICRWLSAGAINSFDSDFSNSIGGYAAGSMVISDDLSKIYVNKVDNNTNNPNLINTGWQDLLSYLGLGDDAHLSGNLTVKGGFWDTYPGDTPQRVWSPNNKPSLSDLGVVDATTTQKGIVELATNAEMATGTSSSLVPSVAAVMSIFSKRSFSANDYVRIPDVPGGLIIQWVSGNASANGVFFAQMPIPFPNKLLFAGAVEAGANVWGTDSATTWGIDFANSSLSQVIAYARRIFPTTVTQEAAAGLVIAIGN
ncbi:phage tail protein [Citrobacter portucalensis]|uniref:gp53-like domain-containing protein n=2 Tax=Citrobacter portucalensis TaxID=1639133 RepID=UPI00351D1304